MGACFQAPCAAPGQRPMETLLCLTFLSFHHYPHRHMSLHMHKTTSKLAKCAGIFVWMGCLEPLTISSQGQGENNKKK